MGDALSPSWVLTRRPESPPSHRLFGGNLGLRRRRGAPVGKNDQVSRMDGMAAVGWPAVELTNLRYPEAGIVVAYESQPPPQPPECVARLDDDAHRPGGSPDEVGLPHHHDPPPGGRDDEDDQP